MIQVTVQHFGWIIAAWFCCNVTLSFVRSDVLILVEKHIHYVIVLRTPPKEAGRLVVAHKADPKTSTFQRKDEAHG
jgi:hypothetical protein